ncbi:MAG: hypothetical protein AAF682_13885 [Planctomycetota bacterium]
MRNPLLGSLLLPLVAGVSDAQLLTGTQLVDINSDPAVVGSFSGGFASDGQLVFFEGVDAVSGESFRLWATDGTAAGSEQIADLALNPIESAFVPGGDLVVAADALGIGVGLWRSDGTAAGTQELLAPVEWIVEPYDLTVFGGDLWFLADLAGTGVEVWKTDLASGATSLELDLLPGPLPGASHLFAGAGKLFVVGGLLSQLFATDGTLAGLTSLASFALADSSSFRFPVEVGARVIFDVAGFGPDAGWWSSDGTPGGTSLLLATFNDFWAAEGSTKAYITGGSVASSPLLFETDGTVAGTLPIDLPSTSGGQRVSFDPGFALGDELFYGGLVPGAGIEPCRTSGAAGGAALVEDIHPSGNSQPNDFVAFGAEVFFRADDGATGREIWKLDPAGTGAQQVADLTPGPFAQIVGASPTILPAAAGVVFGFAFADVGVEPAVTDGVQTGLLLNIGDDGLSAGSGPSEFLRFGSRALFAAFDEAVGNELWITDGSAAGTQLVANIDPVDAGFSGAFGSFPRHLVLLGDSAFFFAGTPSSGRELWSTDGTEAGTALVADLVPGPGSSEPLFSAPPVVLGDALFFIAREPGGAFALWRTDGATLATTKVLTTDPTGFVAEFSVIERVGERIVFTANGPEGLELWGSDGTAAGSSVLVDMTPGPGGTFFSRVVPGETQALVFTPNADVQLWRTDGTVAGTQPVLANPGLNANSSSVGAAGDDFYFSVFDPATGREPWVSDGTTAGTVPLLDIVPGPTGSDATSFTQADDRVFFQVQSPPGSSHFGQVWITDGTTAGTTLVADLPSPIAGAGVGDFWAPAADRRLVFSNVDANGEEWWVSDGTALGTVPLTDSAPGGKFANPRPGVLLGDQLLFSATDGVNGEEPHVLPLVATGGYAATSLGTGCAGAGGVPTLLLESGAVAVGEAPSLGVRNAAPTSSALWFYDLGYGALPAVGTCALQLPAPKLLVTTATDATGASSLPLAVADDASLAGLRFDFQVFSLELGGPFFGLGAVSDVLELVLGP